jgi:hypothetical protein
MARSATNPPHRSATVFRTQRSLYAHLLASGHRSGNYLDTHRTPDGDEKVVGITPSPVHQKSRHSSGARQLFCKVDKLVNEFNREKIKRKIN